MTQPFSSLASINPESLALSASLFTSQIASWIPADFGISSTTTNSSTGAGNKQNQVDDFIQLATASDRNERLGLGHPLLSVPKNQRGGLGGSASLLGLSKRLGINSENGQIGMGMGMAKGKRKVGEDGEVGVGTGLNGTAPDARRSGDDEEDDEDESAGESRARIAKKSRKNAALDLLSGKKKKKKQQVLLAAGHDVHSPHSKSAGASNGSRHDASEARNIDHAPTAQSGPVQPESALERLERLGSLADATSGSRLHGVNSARDVNEEPTEPENKHAATSNDDQKEKAGMSSTARSPVGTPTAVGSSKTKKRREKRKEKQKQKQALAGLLET